METHNKEYMGTLKTAVETVRASGQYKLIQRLDIDNHPGFTPAEEGDVLKVGACLDTETTGFSPDKDKIIELGIVLFEFTAEPHFKITRIIDRYNGFEDPGEPLDQEIKDVTGITDEDLAGQKFDDEKINAMLDRADLIIAHNSAFDRPFTEARFPVTIKKCWACSLAQINWKAEYIAAAKLEYLLFKCGGWFIDAHRALNDAEGLLALLMEKLSHTGGRVFEQILKKARSHDTRLYAVGSPFDTKDKLRENGYRWEPGGNGKSKAWWKDVDGRPDAELSWLGENIYPDGDTSGVIQIPVNAFVRFSNR